MITSSGPIIPGVRRIEAKTIEVTVGDNGEVTVYFEKPFDKTPIVIVNLWDQGSPQGFINLIEVTREYFKFRVIAGFKTSSSDSNANAVTSVSYTREFAITGMSFGQNYGYLIENYSHDSYVTSVSGPTVSVIDSITLGLKSATEDVSATWSYNSFQLCGSDSCDSAVDYLSISEYKDNFAYDYDTSTETVVDYISASETPGYLPTSVSHDGFFVDASASGDYFVDAISTSTNSFALSDHTHVASSQEGIAVPISGLTYTISYIAIETA